MSSFSVCLIDPSYSGSGNAPHLGLGYLAAIARAEGADVDILSLEAMNLSIKDCCKRIAERGYSLVGISCYTASFPSSVRLSAIIREKWADIKIVLGGIYPTFAHTEILEKFPFIDAVVRHEGELSLQDIIRSECNFCHVRGVTFRNGKKIVVNPDAPVIDDLDRLPPPARDLLSLEIFDPAMQGSILSSRGCPHQCIFCSCQSMFRKFRKHSVARVFEEIDTLVQKYHIDAITFVDDAFTLNRKWLYEYCERMKGTNITWVCSSRVDSLDEDILELMARAGCNKIFLGIESLTPNVLRLVKKGVSREKMLGILRAAQDCGITVTCGIIIGLPGETRESLSETLQTFREMNVEISPAFLTPVVGTQLYKWREKYQVRLVEKDLEKYNYTSPVATIPFFSTDEQRKFFLDFMLLNLDVTSFEIAEDS